MARITHKAWNNNSNNNNVDEFYYVYKWHKHDLKVDLENRTKIL